MKKITITVVLISLVTTISAQSELNPTRKNAVHLDVGGWSFFYSLNYERRISFAENHRIALGGGFNVLPPGFLVGISANYLYGKTHNLEIGVTPSVLVNEKEFYFSPRIGYRYETPKGFLFRIGTAPSLFVEDGIGISTLSWGYLSFGYTF